MEQKHKPLLRQQLADTPDTDSLMLLTQIENFMSKRVSFNVRKQQ